MVIRLTGEIEEALATPVAELEAIAAAELALSGEDSAGEHYPLSGEICAISDSAN